MKRYAERSKAKKYRTILHYFGASKPEGEGLPSPPNPRFWGSASELVMNIYVNITITFSNRNLLRSEWQRNVSSARRDGTDLRSFCNRQWS